jgi:hypothetical protein
MEKPMDKDIEIAAIKLVDFIEQKKLYILAEFESGGKVLIQYAAELRKALDPITTGTNNVAFGSQALVKPRSVWTSGTIEVPASTEEREK